MNFKNIINWMVQELSHPIGESLFGTLLLVVIIILIGYACIKIVD